TRVTSVGHAAMASFRCIATDFLKRLDLAFAGGFWGRAPSPRSVNRIARGIKQSNRLRKDPLRARAGAFMPSRNRTTGRIEMSAFCIDFMAHAAACSLIRKRTKSKLHA